MRDEAPGKAGLDLGTVGLDAHEPLGLTPTLPVLKRANSAVCRALTSEGVAAAPCFQRRSAIHCMASMARGSLSVQMRLSSGSWTFAPQDQMAVEMVNSRAQLPSYQSCTGAPSSARSLIAIVRVSLEP